MNLETSANKIETQYLALTLESYVGDRNPHQDCKDCTSRPSIEGLGNWERKIHETAKWRDNTKA